MSPARHSCRPEQRPEHHTTVTTTDCASSSPLFRRIPGITCQLLANLRLIAHHHNRHQLRLDIFCGGLFHFIRRDRIHPLHIRFQVILAQSLQIHKPQLPNQGLRRIRILNHEKPRKVTLYPLQLRRSRRFLLQPRNFPRQSPSAKPPCRLVVTSTQSPPNTHRDTGWKSGCAANTYSPSAREYSQ